MGCEGAAKRSHRQADVLDTATTTGMCFRGATNDETAASVLLSADMLGNIRTQTLGAFTSVEMEEILANIP